MHAVLAATDSVSGPSSGFSPTGPPGAPAIVIGGSEDSRLLLRGLLRLHRHRVILEAPTREGLERVPPSSETKILVFDAGSSKSEAWADELTAALRGRPDLEALVILPGTDPALATKARLAGAKSVLVRPFAIRDFIEAVDIVGALTSRH